MRTAIDTNVICSLWSREPDAAELARFLGQAGADGGLVICAPVDVELLAHPKAAQSFVDDFLSATSIVVDFLLDEQVWRSAGEAFTAYAGRRRASDGGQPKRLLVDFLVGAHATLNADRLCTLDETRYATAFPKLKIVRLSDRAS